MKSKIISYGDQSEITLDNIATQELTLNDTKSQKREILCEDIAKRDVKTKHFRLKNGNYLAVMYDRSIHRESEDSTCYTDITHSYIDSGDAYEAILESYKVRFPKKEGKRKFTTVNKGDKTIAWKYIPQGSASRKMSIAETMEIEHKSQWNPTTFPSLVYKKADKYTTLEYFVSDDGIKENIILDRGINVSVFEFELKLIGLYPKLSEDHKSICLYVDAMHETPPEAIIPSANMTDANGVYSEDIHYELIVKENYYVLRLIADKNWLSASERAYPVTIDPRIEIPGTSSTSLYMVEVVSNDSKVTSGTTRNVGIDANGNRHRIFAKWDKPVLPKGYKIVKAGIEFHQSSYFSANDEYIVCPVNSDWRISGISWDQQPEVDTSNPYDVIISKYRKPSDAISVDMTQAFIDWYSNGSDINGVMIKKKNESISYASCNSGTDCIVAPEFINFYSDASTDDTRTLVFIEYASEDNYTANQKFYTFEHGRAGTGSINMFTGKMSFAHGDVSTEGAKLPLSISHVFRNEYVNDNESTRYGNGWKLSVEQSINVVNAMGIVAVYTNAQGKHHYFVEKEDGAIIDDAGLGLTFKHECQDNSFCCYSITDKKGNRMLFNSAGKLYNISEANGTECNLIYSGNKLTKVIDGNNKMAMLGYDTDGKLKSITDPDGRVMSYHYNSAGRLIRIDYPTSSDQTLSTAFYYDSQGKLTDITDVTGTVYMLNYYDDGKVKSIKYYGTKRVDNDSESEYTSADDRDYDSEYFVFNYYTSSTIVNNKLTGEKTVYRLDENGKERYVYQDLTQCNNAIKRNETTIAEIKEYAYEKENREGVVVDSRRTTTVSLNVDSDNEVNLLKNGCFTNETSNWEVVGRKSGFDCVESNDGYLVDKKSYRFDEGNTNSNKYLLQTVELNDCCLKKNILVASAWAKATKNVKGTGESTEAKFCLHVKVTRSAGNVEEYTEYFDSSRDNEWQFVAIPIMYANRFYSPIVNVEFKLDYSSNTGTCNFTNARLVNINGLSSSCVFNNNGLRLYTREIFGVSRSIMTETTKTDGAVTTIELTDNRNDVVQTTVYDSGDCALTSCYQYDRKHNIKKSQDSHGLITEYTYNEYGALMTQKTYHVDDPSHYMFSENTYSEGYFLESERDPRYFYGTDEIRTTYDYDTSRGLMTKQTDVAGQEYNYDYDDQTDDLKTLSSTVNGTTLENQFSYRRGYLTRVSHNGFNFDFAYDKLGRNESITVGTDSKKYILEQNTYAKDDISETVETTYATQEKIKAISNVFKNPVKTYYTNAAGSQRTLAEIEYNCAQTPVKVVDYEEDICYKYKYNSNGDVSSVTLYDLDGNYISSKTFEYDDDGNLTKKTYNGVTVDSQVYQPIYATDSEGHKFPDNEVIGIEMVGRFKDVVDKDAFGRATAKTLSNLRNNATVDLFKDTYKYLSTKKDDDEFIETQFVSSVTSKVSGVDEDTIEYTYEYDKAGNLSVVKADGQLAVKYHYDDLGRLVREDNRASNKTCVWLYNVGGNITEKRVYSYTSDLNLGTNYQSFVYTYETDGWKDQLKSFDGLNCVYDKQGNPTTYLGNTLEWTKVRRLSRFGANTFSYNSSGIRYRKNNIEYTLDGNKILRQSDGTTRLLFLYGGSGVVGFSYNGTDYYYRKNLQGDVIAIYKNNGQCVAEYAYDAWGKVLSVNNLTDANIGTLNPFRYRSYYYDTETGLYYLNSRYYDPETGRFINADTTAVLDKAKDNIGGLNLYAYCDNNPVVGRDDEGNMSFWAKLAIAVAAVVVVAVVAAVVTVATGGTGAAALCAVASTFVGAAKGAVVGAVTGAISGAAMGAVTGAVEGYRENGWDGVLSGAAKGAWKGAVEGAEAGLLSGMVMGGIGGAMNPSFCFVAGTAVLTTAGKKAIETIKVGDVIPCVDHITGEESEKQVVSTSVNKVDRLIELDIDGEIIQCTDTHPFQVKGKGWVDAHMLNVGDTVYTKDWNTATIKRVDILELEEHIEVFNFEVDDCHTYYVGDKLVLVHNTCNVHGKSHGSTEHRLAIDTKAKMMKSSGKYSDIWLNKQLKTAGLKGTQRPDIIAKRLDGTFEYIEYASKSQANGTQGLTNLLNKMNIIDDANGIRGILFNWGEY